MEECVVSTMINSNIMHQLILILIQWFIKSIFYEPKHRARLSVKY